MPDEKKIVTVYVAAPYNSDPVHNTNQAIRYANQLVDTGFIPIIPHTNSLLWNLHTPRPESFWYEYVMHLMKLCDAVVRFPGSSVGADREVEEALSLGKPVFYSVYELMSN
jgi:hypothetical protein